MTATKISIIGTGCSTATADSVTDFVAALHSGKDALAAVPTEDWRVAPKPGFEPRAFRWASRASMGTRNLLGAKLLEVFREASSELDENILQSPRVGLILASTKGFIEDFIWNDISDLDSVDSLSPLLDDFKRATGLMPIRNLCVSNACASSLAALSTAKTWLTSSRFDHVIVLACDAVDSFVLHGFHQLRVLSPDRTRPFSGARSGFHLGDAAACMILSNKIQSDVQLLDSRIDSEGHAATRPSHSGDSLLRAARALDHLADKPVDLVIAHGTSTQANDVTEDRVFSALFADSAPKPLITGTKWSVGHTLGAAGLLDVIAATEILKSQKPFPIFTTEESDPSFKGRYLTRRTTTPPTDLPSRNTSVSRILVTSLGFGGVHAATLVGRA